MGFRFHLLVIPPLVFLHFVLAKDEGFDSIFLKFGDNHFLWLKEMILVSRRYKSINERHSYHQVLFPF
jgi:hypothetical protein